MELLIIAIVISAISIYGAVMLKRLYFLLGYFLFSLLAISSFIPTFNDDKMLSLTNLALFLMMGIISFPAKKKYWRLRDERRGKTFSKVIYAKNTALVKCCKYCGYFLSEV